MRFGDAEVFLDEMSEEEPRFGQHGPTQDVIVFRVQVLVWRGGVDQFQIQPLVKEFVDEPVAACVGEHAADLSVQCFYVGELSVTGKLKQFLIGRAAPEEV